MSNAQEILAQAMGLPPPRAIASGAEPHIDTSFYYAAVARNTLIAVCMLLVLWLLYLVVQAARRSRGPRLAPVPLDYREQRRLMRAQPADNK
jgi:hypothetical protein